MKIPRKRLNQSSVFGAEDDDEEVDQSGPSAPNKPSYNGPQRQAAAQDKAILDYDGFFETKRQQELVKKKALETDKKKVLALICGRALNLAA
jgi:hypothetical protein